MRRLVLVAVLCGITLPALADNDWHLARDRDGIKIWTKLEDGHAIETYRAETIINAAPNDIAGQIIDIAVFKTWAPDIREAHAIKTEEGAAPLSYVAYAMPFPVRDRDLAQSTTVDSADDGAVHILMTAQPKAWPEQKRRVRVRHSRLEWQLSPQENGPGSRVICTGYADPEGGVPPFVINMLLVEGPYGTLKALRTHVETTKN